MRPLIALIALLMASPTRAEPGEVARVMAWLTSLAVGAALLRLADAPDDPGGGRVGAETAEHFHRHVLVGRAADQAVGAGKVDDRCGAAVGEVTELARLVVSDIDPMAESHVIDIDVSILKQAWQKPLRQ